MILSFTFIINVDDDDDDDADDSSVRLKAPPGGRYAESGRHKPFEAADPSTVV